MNIRVDVAQIEGAIAGLLATYPELAEDEALRSDVIEGETDLHSVLTRLVRIAADADDMAAAIKTRKAALTERQARFERREEAIRSLITSLMGRADLSKLVLPEATLSVAARKPRPQVFDEAQLPEELWRVRREPDLKKIQDAYVQTGLLPPGVSMTNGGEPVLTIRTR